MLFDMSMVYMDKVTGYKVETSNPTGFLEKQIREQLISKKWWSPYLYRRGKNFVCGKIRLGLFLDLCFTPVLKQHKKPERGKQNWFWILKQFTRLKTNLKALGLDWQVLKWNNQLSKPSWQMHHIILYMRARLKPGWVWKVFHFTFWVVVNFSMGGR